MVDKIDSSLESQKESITFDPALGWSENEKQTASNLVRVYSFFYNLGTPNISFKKGKGPKDGTIAHTEGIIIYIGPDFNKSGMKQMVMHEMGHTISGPLKIVSGVNFKNDPGTDKLSGFKGFNIRVNRADGKGIGNIAIFEEGFCERLALNFYRQQGDRYTNNPKYAYRGLLMDILIKQKRGFDVQLMIRYKKSSDVYSMLTYLFGHKVDTSNISVIVNELRQNQHDLQITKTPGLVLDRLEMVIVKLKTKLL